MKYEALLKRLAPLLVLLTGLTLACTSEERRALTLAQALVACEEAGKAACVEEKLDLDWRARALLGDIYGGAQPESQGAFRALLARVIIQAQGLRQREFQGAEGEWEARSDAAGQVQVLQWAPGRRFAYIYDVDTAQGRVRDRGHQRDGQRAEPAVVVKRFQKDWQEANGRAPTLEDYLKDFEGYLQGRRLRTWKVPGRS